MYDYSDFDRAFVRERVAEFRDQVERRIAGALTEAEFLPLRLRNGLYLQLHAYMLRIAIPYGTLNARKLRQLAYIAERWDKGYGHFTTRHEHPVQLAEAARRARHPRRAGGRRDARDPDQRQLRAQRDRRPFRRRRRRRDRGSAARRPSCIRQWSTDHPEFNWLRRKFKIGISGAAHDRAVIRSHDIGLRMLPQRRRARPASRSWSAAASGGRR